LFTTVNLLDKLTLFGMIFAGDIIPPFPIWIDAALKVRLPLKG